MYLVLLRFRMAFLRHAVCAAEIASVRHGNPQVAHQSSQLIQLGVRRHASFLLHIAVHASARFILAAADWFSALNFRLHSGRL